MTPDDATARIAVSLPELTGLPVAPVAVQGWDFFTFLVGEWVFRFPRNEECARGLLREIALLPHIARSLSVAVPDPVFVSTDPSPVAGYRFIAGAPTPRSAPPAVGEALGRVVAELHRLPASLGITAGLDAGYRAADDATLDRLSKGVLPLLDPHERPAAETLIDALRASPPGEPVVRHSDLGREHALSQDDVLVGIIDWGDVSIGDAAIDLAWALAGMPEAFAAAFARGYGGIDDNLRHRAHLLWAKSPWHEVTYGLRTGQPSFVATGLEGVRARLPS